MLTIFLIFFAEPKEVISLNKEFDRIEFYDNQIYLAPFISTSIFKLTQSRDLEPISFTDEANYSIYGFHITPFAIYLNNNKAIEKFYFSSGIKENIYSSRGISSFIVTSSDEVILANQSNDELSFLDFTNQLKFKKTDLHIKDLQTSKNFIYALTNNRIIRYDEYGNVIEEKKIPEKLDRILVDGATIFLFSHNKKYFYKFNNQWQKIEFTYGISDICQNDESIIILDGNGTNLYIFDKSDF